MRPKRLEWKDDEDGGETASVGVTLGRFEITIFPDDRRWMLWIGRGSQTYKLLKSAHYDTKSEAKLAGEQIWRLMVMELLEGDE